MTRLHRFQRLRKDDRGSLPIILAFMMVPLAGIVGGAVDFGHAVSERTRLNTALDAAALVAARAAQDADAAGKSDAEVRTIAAKAGADYFNAMKNLPADSAGKVEVQIANRVATISASYSASMPTTMLGILGYKSLPISSKASSTVNLSPLVDIHLLIDVSGSMAIGATAADIAKLQSRFNCAFACHDGVPVIDTVTTGPWWNRKTTTTTYADSFDWAQKNNVLLRINEVKKGITDFVNELTAQPSLSKRLRISVHAFSNELNQLVPLTDNLQQASKAVPATPSASNEYDGATHFAENMQAFANFVGKPGDGTTKPQKLVIIATDGVQDPNRTWTWNTSLRPQVRPFSPSDCKKLDPGVKIGVLYTPYINLSPDWGFEATLGQPSQIGNPGTRFTDIVPQLEACASPKMFVDAASKDTMGKAFKAIWDFYTLARLSK